MHCSICDQPLMETARTIPTTDGGAAHLRCARQQGTETQAEQHQQAVVMAVVKLSTVMLLLSYGRPDLAALALLAGLIAHVATNWRWWSYQISMARGRMGLAS